MASKFEFHVNDDAFEQIKAEAVRKVAAAYQPLLDSLVDRYRGHPVEEIKPVLASEWHAVNNGEISEPQLTSWATAISEGTRIVMQPQT